MSEWIEYKPGVKIKKLASLPEGGFCLVRVLPGAIIPREAHRQRETIVVLEGGVDVVVWHERGSDRCCVYSRRFAEIEPFVEHEIRGRYDMSSLLLVVARPDFDGVTTDAEAAETRGPALPHDIGTIKARAETLVASWEAWGTCHALGAHLYDLREALRGAHPRWLDRAPTEKEIAAHADAHPSKGGYGLWMYVGNEGSRPTLLWLGGAERFDGWPAGRWRPLTADGDSALMPVAT